MFFEASAEIFARAKSLRANMTTSECRVWEEIKSSFAGFKFRRQHPMGPYIADFYCHKLKLVIELDGKHHYDNKSQMLLDKQRDEDMKKWGINILRYPNNVKRATLFKDIEDLISQYKIDNK